MFEFLEERKKESNKEEKVLLALDLSCAEERAVASNPPEPDGEKSTLML